MTKLNMILPTETTTIAENLTVETATMLTLAYVAEHDITDDVDAVFVDEAGAEHEFDFGSECFR